MNIIIFGFFYNVLFLRENEFTQSKQIHLKNVDLKMKYEDMKIELENILGGGFVGDMANEVLTLIGQDFIFAHKWFFCDLVDDWSSRYILTLNIGLSTIVFQVTSRPSELRTVHLALPVHLERV